MPPRLAQVRKSIRIFGQNAVRLAATVAVIEFWSFSRIWSWRLR